MLPPFGLARLMVVPLFALVMGQVVLLALLGGGVSRDFPLVLSPVLGGFFAFGSGSHPAGRFYVVLTMVVYPLILLASLSVARSGGYRLVRRPGEAT